MLEDLATAVRRRDAELEHLDRAVLGVRYPGRDDDEGDLGDVLPGTPDDVDDDIDLSGVNSLTPEDDEVEAANHTDVIGPRYGGWRHRLLADSRKVAAAIWSELAERAVSLRDRARNLRAGQSRAGSPPNEENTDE